MMTPLGVMIAVYAVAIAVQIVFTFDANRKQLLVGRWQAEVPAMTAARRGEVSSDGRDQKDDAKLTALVYFDVPAGDLRWRPIEMRAIHQSCPGQHVMKFTCSLNGSIVTLALRKDPCPKMTALFNEPIRLRMSLNGKRLTAISGNPFDDDFIFDRKPDFVDLARAPGCASLKDRMVGHWRESAGQDLDFPGWIPESPYLRRLRTLDGETIVKDATLCSPYLDLTKERHLDNAKDRSVFRLGLRYKGDEKLIQEGNQQKGVKTITRYSVYKLVVKGAWSVSGAVVTLVPETISFPSGVRGQYLTEACSSEPMRLQVSDDGLQLTVLSDDQNGSNIVFKLWEEWCTDGGASPFDKWKIPSRPFCVRSISGKSPAARLRPDRSTRRRNADPVSSSDEWIP